MRLSSISRCLTVSALALGFVLSCGGDDDSGDGAMCTGDIACGGKLEGGWKLTDACYSVLKQPDYPPCPTATAELHATTADGNVTFEKDVYELHLDLVTKMKLNIPAKCKEDTKRECKGFGGTLGSGIALECKDAGDGCSCTADIPARTNGSGGYSIRGNRVELNDAYDYCVKGNKLTLKPTRAVEMSGSEATSDVVFSFEKN